MKKKKIAFVTPIYLPANLYGSDTYVRMLAEEFARNGFRTSVITSNALMPKYWHDPFFSPRVTRPFEIINDVRTYRLLCNHVFSDVCYILQKYLSPFFSRQKTNEFKIMYSGPALRGLNNLLQRERFDIIHCSPFPLFINKQAEDIIAGYKQKPKLILTPFFHARVAEYANSALKVVLDKADVIHVITNSEKKDIMKMHKISLDKIKVIPLFLNIHDMHKIEELSADIQKFKKLHHILNKKIVLFAGLKGSMKGAVNLLYAMNRLYQTNKKFVLIAIGHNTTEWEKAKQNIDTDMLIDLGYKKGKEKEIIFGACDIFCMPSRSDSFGLVYLEAWHKKKPVIGADIPAVRELIGENKGGLLVKFGDHKELKSAIERLISNSALSKKLGGYGYRAVMEKYNLDLVFSRYKNLFIK